MLGKLCFILSMVAVSIFFCSICCADSSSLYRTAETVSMIDNNNVRMVAEDIYIKAYSGFSVANCEFTFKNETETEQQVLMGFPASLFGTEGQKEIDGTTRLSEFKTFIDGTEKEVLLEKAKDESEDTHGKIAEWYTWSVLFKPGEVKKVVNTYTTYNYSAPWARKTGYILTTGAPWKGNIGKATITFELMDISPAKIDTKATKPEGYHIDKNKVVWEFSNFEPDTDISLISPGFVISSHTLSGYSDEKLQSELEPKMWEIHQLMLSGRYGEGLKEIRNMMDQGFVYEELYFDLLNYYRTNNDEDMFIRVLKEQIEKLNSANIYEWALSIYPDRMKKEGITYPKDHKPEIKNERLTLIDDGYFELSADLSDPAGDMRFFNAFAYTELSDNKSLIGARPSKSLLGVREYHYKETGLLPGKFSDMVYKLEVTDCKGDRTCSAETQGYKPGETYYFYTGKALEKWNTRKNPKFILCYYDKALGSMENELTGELARIIDKTIAALGINPPKTGYMINFYNPAHFPYLKTEEPQNITKAFKHEYYSSALHNAGVQNRSSQQYNTNKNVPDGSFIQKSSEFTYDWGEISVPADYKSVEKNADQVLLRIMAKYLGTGWLRLDHEISGDFFAVIKGTKGNGKYYSTFSEMNSGELKDAAKYIGLHGNADKFLPLSKTGSSEVDLNGQVGRTGNATAIVVIASAAAVVGLVVFTVLRKKRRQTINK